MGQFFVAFSEYRNFTKKQIIKKVLALGLRLFQFLFFKKLSLIHRKIRLYIRQIFFVSIFIFSWLPPSWWSKVLESEICHDIFITFSPIILFYFNLSKMKPLFCNIKFIYSEKATKFCDIFTLLLSYVVPVKSKGEISQNFVAFSEYMNFIIICVILSYFGQPMRTEGFLVLFGNSAENVCNLYKCFLTASYQRSAVQRISFD